MAKANGRQARRDIVESVTDIVIEAKGLLIPKDNLGPQLLDRATGLPDDLWQKRGSRLERMRRQRLESAFALNFGEVPPCSTVEVFFSCG